MRQGALRSVILQMSLQFIGEFAAVGRALTKTFLHSPFMLFEPSAIPLWYIWSYENKFSRPYMPQMNERLSPLSKTATGKNH